MQVKTKYVKFNIQITTDTHILKSGLHEFLSWSTFKKQLFINTCLNLISLGNMEKKSYFKKIK